MVALLILAGLLILIFGLVVLRGAPYVPTLRKVASQLFELVPDQGTLVDLGSGDGAVLVAGAKRGRKVHGIEINPLLVAISWLRIRRYRLLASVSLGDFWFKDLPDDTTAVFVFLAGPFMDKLDAYTQRQADGLGHEVILISYAFEIRGRKPERKNGPLIAYRYTPNSLQ